MENSDFWFGHFMPALAPPPHTKNDKVVGVLLSSCDKSDPHVEDLNFGLELSFRIF